MRIIKRRKIKIMSLSQFYKIKNLKHKNQNNQKPANIFQKNTTDNKQPDIFKTSTNLFDLQHKLLAYMIIQNYQAINTIPAFSYKQAKIIQKFNSFQKKRQLQSQSKQQEYEYEQELNENIEGKKQFCQKNSQKHTSINRKLHNIGKKFKRGNSNLIQNAIVSIQKYKHTQKHLLCVRLPNKCNYFIRIILIGLSFEDKSKMIIDSFDKDNRLKPEILKVQFKQPVYREKFLQKFKEASQAINQQS